MQGAKPQLPSNFKLELIEGANPELIEFCAWCNNEIEINEKVKGFNWRFMNFGNDNDFLEEYKKHLVKLEYALDKNDMRRIKEHIADNMCYLMFLAVSKGLIKISNK